MDWLLPVIGGLVLIIVTIVALYGGFNMKGLFLLIGQVVVSIGIFFVFNVVMPTYLSAIFAVVVFLFLLVLEDAIGSWR